MVSRPFSRLAAACGTAMLLLASCSNDTNAPRADVRLEGPATRTAVPVDPETQMQLAAEFLLGGRKTVGGPGTGWPDTLTLPLRAELDAIADGALRSLVLESGHGVDASWSPWADRVATQNALVDTNNNGSTRDEALAMQRERYGFRSNGIVPAGIRPGIVFPSQIDPKLATAPTGRADASRLALRPAADKRREFTVGQIATTMLAALRRAAPLLAAGRGDLYGATPEEGMRGLLLVEQAVAAERFLIESLAWDGNRLTKIPDPEKYDPKKLPYVFPGRLAYDLSSSASGPKEPNFYVLDRGSRLIDQARLLAAFAELAWLADSRQPHPRLSRLFAGDPFGDPPNPNARRDKSRAGGGVEHPNELITWNKHIEGLLAGACAGLPCHDPGTTNGFSIKSYKAVLEGGKNQATNPIIVDKDPAKSLLWQIVALDKPPVSERMPDGGPPWLSQGEIDLIAQWIRDGALEKDDSVPDVPPVPGLDGLRVVLANLLAVHQDPKSLWCVDRSGLDALDDGKGRGTVVRPGSHGELLSGLALALEARPDLRFIRPLLAIQVDLAMDFLIDREGAVAESFEITEKRVSNAPAHLGEVAALAAGLFDAARILRTKASLDAAKLVATHLRANYFVGTDQLLSYPGRPASRVTPETTARLLATLRLWAATGETSAVTLYRDVWAAFRSRLVLAEWPASGEDFGDSNPDTDKDGIPEVGTDGLPPLFAPLLENEAMRNGIGVPERPLHYSHDVLPILIVHCGECHTGAAKLGEFRLDLFDELFEGGGWKSQTTSIVPFDAEKSFFYRKAVDRPPSLGGEMPEGRPPLAPSAKELIRRWIDAGAIKG